ncbi:MAG: hypothetical protein WDM70_10810 [Nitrosomonadales bacterium]
MDLRSAVAAKSRCIATRVVAALETYIGSGRGRGWPITCRGRLQGNGVACGDRSQRGVTYSLICAATFRTSLWAKSPRVPKLARDMGYLKSSDRIVLNQYELLHVAKQEARALTATAYRPPLAHRQIAVAGVPVSLP